ncbi:MAG: radical SAM protein [Ruminococcaceae bacterium]|nr:radical SAM protein [Oscillospiraceae bacterium]
MYNKVYIEITNICNMNCSFCHGHKRAPKRMSLDEFILILNKLKEQTKYIYYHLMGEPLTHPLLPEFIKLAWEKGYKSIITTNGTLLHKRGDEILDAGIHKINISIHSFETGNEEEHTKYICELAEFSKKAADRGVIVVFRLWNKGYDDGKNETALKLLKENIPGDWMDNTRGLKIRDKIYLEWGERFEWPDKEAEVKGNKFFCYGLKDQFGILSDGTVVPCCLDSEGVINLGNIFTEDINTILRSPRATAIVESFKCGKASEELCKRCGYAQRFV